MRSSLINTDFAKVVTELRINRYDFHVTENPITYEIDTIFCELTFSLTGKLLSVYNKLEEKSKVGASPIIDSRPAILLKQLRAYSALARLLSSNDVNGARHYLDQAKKCLALFQKEQEDVTAEYQIKEVA